MMDGLTHMLETAMDGTFCEQSFDESRQSALENQLAQYLKASELSVRNIASEREKNKGIDRGHIPSDTDTAFEYFTVHRVVGRRDSIRESGLFAEAASADGKTSVFDRWTC